MIPCQETRAIFVVLLQLVCFQICLATECNFVISTNLESMDGGWIEGLFTSPNGPENYLNQANCSWLIHTKNPIIISFTHFYLELSSYLKIYDGPTILSLLLLEASGNNNPPSVVSTTNQILITFTSDQFYSYSEFNATYSSYRCQHFLSSESGWFSSQNNSLNSFEDTNCRWFIQTKRPITFSFSHFHLENDKDSLMIYDGPTESSEILFKGSSSNNQIPSFIETTTNQALVVFSFDKSGHHSGFNATYQPFRCQYILSSESGLVKSPKISKHYPAANCSWLINATQPISLSFNKFNIKKSNDSVKIYDGLSTAVELSVSSPYQNKPSRIISSTNQMLITFTSEPSKSYSGFIAYFEPSRCQEMLSDSGWFTLPNYPLNYPDNSRNCWLIKATNPIMLSFISFHRKNYWERLTIYNGQSTAVKVLELPFYNSNQQLIIPGTNEILITFSSEGSQSFSGFNATYSPSICQEISSPDSGWFTTPNYPLKYSDNLKLCWSINARQPIKLSFNHFNVEENRHVFIGVYDGLSTSLSLLPNSLNALVDYSIISNSNQMLVTFISDGSGSFIGFNATYEPHRCHQILSSDSGWFTLRDGWYDFAPKFNRSWLINATRPIILSSNHFMVSVKEERLTIYDGPTTSSALLLNSSFTDPFLVASTTNQMLIVFTSSLPKSFSQFNATYYASECTHYLNSESGWFSSPKHPLNYTGDNCCRWFFNTKKRITFSFHHFHLENYKDRLTIYDGPTESSKILFKGSSDNQIPSSLETTTKEALVVFSSEKPGPYSGFNATYQPLTCQYNLSTDWGEINSIKHYPAANCSWLINATQPISLSFTNFEFEGYDSVKVYDGSSTQVELFVRKSSGKENIPYFIISSTNQMLITFTSEALKSYSGFIASYKPSRCQKLLSDSGWFTSPNYPLNYPGYSRNCWVIKATYPIMLSFISFHLKEYRDWLTIYKGQSTAVEFLKLSSNNTNTELIIPGTNQILITFTSDGSNSFSGFNATYSPSICQEISSPDAGWFSTPNYLLNYSDNLRLCWSINAKQPIKISFNHFNVEENRDVLRVYDGHSTSLSLLPTSLNDLIDYSIISNSNQMLVTFTSDGSGSFSGFNATYEPYRCHQILSSDSGWFTLKDGPFDYAPKFNCSWLINATRRIILVFNKFIVSVEKERLTIYDGPTTSSAILLDSSVTKPFLITSTTNQMLIVFTSSLPETISQFNTTFFCFPHSLF